MRKRVYKKDINHVEISGIIENLPEYVRYVPNPLISFDLISQRRRKSEDQEIKYDNNKIVLFNDEDFLKSAEEGQRYLFIGELQSRNYNRIEEDLDEIFPLAVQNYFMIEQKYPCEIQPAGKKKQPIDWRELLKYQLIPEVPFDSMFDEEMVKGKSQDTPFIYLVDENGDTTKESQHVTYEVLVKEYHKLEEPADPIDGDINYVKMCGRIAKEPRFNFTGLENPVPFVRINVGMKSEIFDTHMFFNHAIAWGKMAEEIYREIKVGDYIFFKGRLQSRDYVKVIKKKHVTSGGNKKKKKIEIPLKTREVSISLVEKCIEKK